MNCNVCNSSNKNLYKNNLICQSCNQLHSYWNKHDKNRLKCKKNEKCDINDCRFCKFQKISQFLKEHKEEKNNTNVQLKSSQKLFKLNDVVFVLQSDGNFYPALIESILNTRSRSFDKTKNDLDFSNKKSNFFYECLFLNRDNKIKTGQINLDDFHKILPIDILIHNDPILIYDENREKWSNGSYIKHHKTSEGKYSFLIRPQKLNRDITCKLENIALPKKNINTFLDRHKIANEIQQQNFEIHPRSPSVEEFLANNPKPVIKLETTKTVVCFTTYCKYEEYFDPLTNELKRNYLSKNTIEEELSSDKIIEILKNTDCTDYDEKSTDLENFYVNDKAKRKLSSEINANQDKLNQSELDSPKPKKRKLSGHLSKKVESLNNSSETNESILDIEKNEEIFNNKETTIDSNSINTTASSAKKIKKIKKTKLKIKFKNFLPKNNCQKKNDQKLDSSISSQQSTNSDILLSSPVNKNLLSNSDIEKKNVSIIIESPKIHSKDDILTDIVIGSKNSITIEKNAKEKVLERPTRTIRKCSQIHSSNEKIDLSTINSSRNNLSNGDKNTSLDSSLNKVEEHNKGISDLNRDRELCLKFNIHKTKVLVSKIDEKYKSLKKKPYILLKSYN